MRDLDIFSPEELKIDYEDFALRQMKPLNDEFRRQRGFEPLTDAEYLKELKLKEEQIAEIKARDLPLVIKPSDGYLRYSDGTIFRHITEYNFALKYDNKT